VNGRSEEPLFEADPEPHLEAGQKVLVRTVWSELLPATVVSTRGAMVWVEFDRNQEQALVMVTSVARAPSKPVV